MPRFFRASDFQMDEDILTIMEDDTYEDAPSSSDRKGRPVIRTADFLEDFGEGDFEDYAEGEVTEGGFSEPGRPLVRPKMPDPFDDEDDDEEYSEDGDVIPLVIRQERERIIREAHAEAEEIISRAQMQVELDRERLMQEVQKDAEVLRQRAYDEAYQQGLLQGIAQQAGTIADCVSELQGSMTRLAGEQAGFMAEYEHNLKWLSLEIASKVLAKHIDEDDTILVDLVLSAVQNVKNASWVSIEVSDQTLRLMETLQSKMQVLREGKTEIRASAVPAGTVVVETPDKLLDASVGRQLENLKRFLQQLD